MMSTAIHIRKANPAEDIPLLTRIIRSSFRDVAERFNLTPENCPKHPSSCSAEWIERDLSRGVLYYILENSGAPVGCVAVEQANSGMCYLERLAVLPGERGKGYGKALVRNVLLKAATLGAEEVGIGIIAAQTDLQKWYEELGFLAGDTKDFPHLPFRVLLMSYPLQHE